MKKGTYNTLNVIKNRKFTNKIQAKLINLLQIQSKLTN